MTGMAWWDNVTLEEIPPKPMQTFLVAPAYRGRITASWPPRIQVDVVVSPSPQVNINTLMLNITLAMTGSTQQRVIESMVIEGSTLPVNRSTVVTLHTDPQHALSSGVYKLAVEAIDHVTMTVLQREVYNLTRVDDARAAPKVTIDGQRRLVVNNKPLFVLGMYAGTLNETDFKRFAASPFNMVMPYKQLNTTQMDMAHANGIRVAYTVKDDYCGHDLKCDNTTNASSVPTDIAKVTEIVSTFKTHPATLVWYTNDELGPTWVPTLDTHNNLIKRLDYDHPTWAVLYEAPEINAYVDTCDAIGTDPYPIPDHNVSEVRDWANDMERLLMHTKAVFEVIQAHNMKNYGHDDGRTPTLQETRSMVWQAINEGANGIVFYSYFDIQRNPDVSFVNEWERLTSVAQEVADFAPCLLSDAGAAPHVRGGAPWLVTRERWCPQNVLLPRWHTDDNEGNAQHTLFEASSLLYVVFAVSDGTNGGNVSLRLPSGVGSAISVTDISVTPPRTLQLTHGNTEWTDTIAMLDMRAYAIVMQRLK